MADSLEQVTPLLLTFNEEANISRTLKCLTWAHQIVVVDSGSTDRTLEILSEVPRLQVIYRPFDSFAHQCNYGLQYVSTPWVLSLDADYFVSGALCSEIEAVLGCSSSCADGYWIPFRYCVAGKPLRGAILPPRMSLYRRDHGHYVDDGHAHRFNLVGVPGSLRQPIFHDDRKALDRWLDSQGRYLRQECHKIMFMPSRQLSLADRLRKRHVIAPFAVLILCLIWHRGFLDGWRGWFYAFQRMYVEILLSLMLWEARHDL